MMTYIKSLQLLMLSILLLNCEGDDLDTSKGYVVSSLFEVNGKQKIDRTSEINPCRVEEVWIFDFPQKQVFHSFDKVDCPPSVWKAGIWEPFDTTYVDSLKGRYFILPLAQVLTTTPPPLHPNFPMQLMKGDFINKSVYYPLFKFDPKELIIRNKFDYRKTPRDTQYFELTMKYVEL